MGKMVNQINYNVKTRIANHELEIFLENCRESLAILESSKKIAPLLKLQ